MRKRLRLMTGLISVAVIFTLAGCATGTCGSCPATSSGGSQTTTTGPLRLTIDHTVYAQGVSVTATVQDIGDQEVDLLIAAGACSVFKLQKQVGAAWVDKPCAVGKGEGPPGYGRLIYFYPGDPGTITTPTVDLESGTYRLQAPYLPPNKRTLSAVQYAYSAAFRICTC